MENALLLPPHFWVVVHIVGIALAVSSRSHLGPMCALCTNCLMTLSMVSVGLVAVVGFLTQQPFWAASGCTLGLMAVVMCFEGNRHEPDRVLQAFAVSDEPLGATWQDC
jgi:hypothetical protein